MPYPIYSSRASVVGDKIYVMGGFTTRYPIAEAEVNIYSIKSDTWESGTQMPFGAAQFGAMSYNNEIYVFGGYNGGVIAKVAVYDSLLGEWKTKPDLPASVYAPVTGKIGNKIYCIGGVNKNMSTVNTVFSLSVEESNDSDKLLSVLLNEAETVQLSISYNLANNTRFTWSSTNESVATVDENGKVTAMSQGETDIYAKSADGFFSEYIHVKVVEGIADELRLAAHLNTGEKARLYLAGEADGVKWSSMDESIAVISTDGEITANGQGLAIVQAEMDGKTYQIYVRVNA